MRKHVVDGKTYLGFSQAPERTYNSSHHITLPSYLGIVIFDKEPHYWALEWTTGPSKGDKITWKMGEEHPTERAITELQRYYREQFGREVRVVVYKRFCAYDS